MRVLVAEVKWNVQGHFYVENFQIQQQESPPERTVSNGVRHERNVEPADTSLLFFEFYQIFFIVFFVCGCWFLWDRGFLWNRALTRPSNFYIWTNHLKWKHEYENTADCCSGDEVTLLFVRKNITHICHEVETTSPTRNCVEWRWNCKNEWECIVCDFTGECCLKGSVHQTACFTEITKVKREGKQLCWLADVSIDSWRFLSDFTKFKIANPLIFTYSLDEDRP